MKLFRELKRWVLDLPSWRTHNPILTIESDDWGSIRMSSSQARDALKSLGHTIEANPYQLYDGLETNEDIDRLQEVLREVSGISGLGAVFTLNYCAANPDFEKIEEANFKRYFREPFHQTYQTYSKSQDVIEKVKNGVHGEVFEVQFHGAEHLNVNRWMRALQKGDKQTREAFYEGIFSPAIASSTGYTMEYMDALDYDNRSEITQQIQSLNEGLNIFREVWGESPQSFIAPCYRWGKPIEDFLAANSIYFIQGQRAQLHPKNEPGFSQRKIYRYTGQKNKLGQIYSVRNVIFEPSLYGQKQALIMAKQQIRYAFKWKLPAIVSSHRINYTSRLDQTNRESSLAALKELLHWVKNEYTDVAFLGSSALSERIKKTKR
ncbi:hypothetical protein [Lewinella cohaerens]|jgi:hypothetical protein|uniref:hypothetical protein n=1 Tax=Lewinella cohaerens TaxID=70995 RepID=UPI0003633AF8|nr:hypothetical protein [Lewinella cohaerens]